jgi:hypothetical protein
VPDKNDFHRYLQVEQEKVPGGVILAYLEEIINSKRYPSSKEIQKKLNSLDHHLIQDLHNYAQRLLTKIYEHSDLKSWRELMKNANFLEYCIVLGNTSYYKKMNASTVVNKLQIMAELLDITLKFKSSETLNQTTSFNEGKDLILFCLEYRNKIFFLFPDGNNANIWKTAKKKEKNEVLIQCSRCDCEYDKRFFNHLVCKCQICDVCILKHDGNKCLKCKKTPKKESLKKFQQEIATQLCAACQMKVPVSFEKSCSCALCLDCIQESPLACKSCGSEGFISNKALEDEWSKKNVIHKFLKEKLEKVKEFEEKIMGNVQEMYKVIETAKNSYLKDLESIKKVINDNLNNLADLTLIKCLSLPKADLEYSINEAAILHLSNNFDLVSFQSFFTNSTTIDFSIEVPVCYLCHNHLFSKPVNLTGCSCKLCKECVKKSFRETSNCPCCSKETTNISELEQYCGDKFIILCKSCYQEKGCTNFEKCPKGCLSCKDCFQRYKEPSPVCPVCSMSLD